MKSKGSAKIFMKKPDEPSSQGSLQMVEKNLFTVSTLVMTLMNETSA